MSGSVLSLSVFEGMSGRVSMMLTSGSTLISEGESVCRSGCSMLVWAGEETTLSRVRAGDGGSPGVSSNSIDRLRASGVPGRDREGCLSIETVNMFECCCSWSSVRDMGRWELVSSSGAGELDLSLPLSPRSLTFFAEALCRG